MTTFLVNGVRRQNKVSSQVRDLCKKQASRMRWSCETQITGPHLRSSWFRMSGLGSWTLPFSKVPLASRQFRRKQQPLRTEHDNRLGQCKLPLQILPVRILKRSFLPLRHLSKWESFFPSRALRGCHPKLLPAPFSLFSSYIIQ